MIGERHVALFNMEPDAGPGLKAAINALPHTRVVLEVSSGLELTEALRRLSVTLLVVHLDPLPEPILQVVEHVSTQFPDIPVVGISEDTNPQTILRAIRSGCRQFVLEPLDAADFSLAVDRVTARRDQAASPGRRICVIGASGGVGTTTISCNLAIELGQLSQSESAVVDLHLEFGDVANAFDSNPVHTIADLCEADREIDARMVESAIVHLPDSHVAVLGRPNNIEQAGIVTPDRAVSVIRMLSQLYPNVVVDMPRSLDRLTLSVLEHAEVVLIVLQLLVPSIRNGTRLYKTLLNYGMPDDRMHVVVNRYRKNVGQVNPDDVKKYFKNGLFAVLPNDYQCVASSLDFGHPLIATAPDSPVRIAIREMAARLCGNAAGDPAAVGGPRKGRLLSRFFGS